MSFKKEKTVKTIITMGKIKNTNDEKPNETKDAYTVMFESYY